MIHPYTALKRMKCPWLDSLTEEVNRSIAEYGEFIKSEAEADKCIDFARESFLYERFVDNNRYGMFYCNVEVLKYFVLYFEQKILYNMIGQWKFTDHDKEMYNYFRDTECHDDRNIIKRIIHYHKEPPGYIGDNACYNKWIVQMQTDSYAHVRVNYVDWFVDQFVACNDMIRNIKNLGLYNDELRLFKNMSLYNIYDIYNYTGFMFDSSRIVLFK